MFGTIELGGGSFQYRQLLAYSLQPKSLKLLKEAELLALLKTLKGERYATEFDLSARFFAFAITKRGTCYIFYFVVFSKTFQIGF